MRLPRALCNVTLVIAGPIPVTVLLVRSGVLRLSEFLFLKFRSDCDEEVLQMGEK